MQSNRSVKSPVVDTPTELPSQSKVEGLGVEPSPYTRILARSILAGFRAQYSEGAVPAETRSRNRERLGEDEPDVSEFDAKHALEDAEVASHAYVPAQIVQGLARELRLLPPRERAYLKLLYSETGAPSGWSRLGPEREQQLQRIVRPWLAFAISDGDLALSAFQSFLDGLVDRTPQEFGAWLEKNVSGPGFFNLLLSNASSPAVQFRDQFLWSQEECYSTWGERTKMAFAGYLREKYSNIESVPASPILARIFGITAFQSERVVLEALHDKLVALDIYPPDMTTVERLERELARVSAVATSDIRAAVDGYLSLLPHIKPEQARELERNLAPTLLAWDEAATHARARIVEQCGNLNNFIRADETRETYAQLVRGKYPDLESVRADRELARELGLSLNVAVEDSASKIVHTTEVVDWRAVRIAKALVELGVYHVEDINLSHIGEGRHCRHSHMHEVVGTRYAEIVRDCFWGQSCPQFAITGNCVEDIRAVAEHSQGLGISVPCSVWTQLLRSPEAFEFLVESTVPSVATLRSAIFHDDNGLRFELMGPSVLQAFTEYAKSRFEKLDDTTASVELAQILGADYFYLQSGGGDVVIRVPNRAAWPIARGLAQLGCFELDWSVGIPLSRSPGSISFHFLPEVVGVEKARENKEKALHSLFETLDDVHAARDGATASLAVRVLLGLSPDSGVDEVAAELFNQGILSPIIPEGHQLPERRMSHYFDPKVVGIFALYNLGLYTQSLSKNADYFSGPIFPNPYSDTDLGRDFAKQMLHLGILSKDVPAGQAPGRSNLRHKSTYFYDAEMVGPEAVTRNIDTFLKGLPHLDAINQHTKGMRVLCGIMGLDFAGIARYAVRKGLQSATPPAGYHVPIRSYYNDHSILKAA